MGTLTLQILPDSAADLDVLQESFWRHALEKDPQNAGLHNSLGIRMSERGRHAEALAFFRDAIRRNPEYAKAHNNLGAAPQKTGRVGEAEKHYRRAVEIEPHYADAACRPSP